MVVHEKPMEAILFNWAAHIPELWQSPHLGHGFAIHGTKGSLAGNIKDFGSKLSGAIHGGMIPDGPPGAPIKSRASQSFGRGVIQMARVVTLKRIVPKEKIFFRETISKRLGRRLETI